MTSADPKIVANRASARGYDVIEAGTGEKALAAAAAEKSDVVLLDLGSPDLNGVEGIRRTREWSPVPMVVLSIRDAETQEVCALDAGAEKSSRRKNTISCICSYRMPVGCSRTK